MRPLAALALALVAAANAAFAGPVAEPAPCWAAFPAAERVACYRIALPADRADPGAGEVVLPIAVLAASAAEPAPDPVIYLEGGPGLPVFRVVYPDHEDYGGFWWSHSAGLRRSRDVILFDQRGIGLAEPSLDCPELHEVAERAGPSPGFDDPVYEREMEALAACYRRLREDGVALERFDTRASADDVADIVAALGYSEVNLYGVSYGTRLALEVMRRHPAIVRSAVLDGVYPPDIDTELEFPASVARAFANLFEDCAADRVCAGLAPDAEAELRRMVRALNAKPRALELYDLDYFEAGTRVRFDGSFVLSFMIDTLYDSHWLTYLPLAIATAAHGEIDALSFFYWAPTFAEWGMDEGAYVNVECREAASLDAAALALAAAAHGIYGEATAGWSLAPYCEAWPVARAPLAVDGPVASDVPTLLLSGRYDPVTPASYAEHAAATLPASRHLVFRAGGHGVTFAFRCALAAAVAFIESPDPGVLAEPTCPDYLRPARFATRF